MLALTLALALNDASACGGLFCNAAQPVDQAGERILFAIHDGEIEVHVQISYQGPAEEFSWIVPTPTQPELLVSADDIFQRLGLSTAPIYQPTIVDLGDCNSAIGRGGGTSAPMADESSDDSDGAYVPPEPAVTVVQELQVGPYDVQVLTASDAGVLVTWLAENGYDLPEGGEAKIAPYVAEGSFYVGLKLQKDKEAGDLAPIAFRYAGTEPTIPLQLTAVAATDDMPLQPFILGSARAVPENYLHVVLNDLAVDWLTAGANYQDVIRRAADEAGGQAFATDVASPVADLDVLLWADDLYPIDELRTVTDAYDLDELLMSLGYISPVDQSWQHERRIPVSNGTVPVLSRFVDVPRGVDPFQFFSCIRCYVNQGAVDVDGAALAAALDTEWAVAMKHAQELLDRSTWLTRLTSSISADEMSVDPRFVLNPDAAAVAGAREADLVYDCRSVHRRSKAPRYLELADGQRLDLPSIDEAAEMGFTWDGWIGELANLTAGVIEQTGRSGDPTMITDNRQAIADVVAALNRSATCGCAAGPGGWSAAWVLLGLAWAARRRGGTCHQA